MLVYTTSCVEVEKALPDRADTVTATDLARSVPTLWPEQGRSGPAAREGPQWRDLRRRQTGVRWWR